MFFDFKGIVITLAALAAVALLCTLDLKCSSRPPDSSRSVVNLVRGELAAGRSAASSAQADSIDLTIRDLRIRARKLVAEGKSRDARPLLTAISELEAQAKRLRNP